jgi:hypothetical protein
MKHTSVHVNRGTVRQKPGLNHRGWLYSKCVVDVQMGSGVLKFVQRVDASHPIRLACSEKARPGALGFRLHQFRELVDLEITRDDAHESAQTNSHTPNQSQWHPSVGMYAQIVAETRIWQNDMRAVANVCAVEVLPPVTSSR